MRWSVSHKESAMTQQLRTVFKRENTPIPSGKPNQKPGVWRKVWTLRCPVCGTGKIFRNFINMAPACTVCGYIYEREQGYFIGAMYINYGVTVLAIMAGWVILELVVKVSWDMMLWLLAIIAIGIPIGFYPYSKALWMALDLSFDPPKTGGHVRSAQPRTQSPETEGSDPNS
jgi:uncharacterized protein (DUF983 family)